MFDLDSNQDLAIKWSLCSVAAVLTAGRVYIRWRQLGALKTDDMLNILALFTLIGYSVMNYVQTWTEDDDTHRKSLLATDFLMWATLWLVKASFLALMWSIFCVSEVFRKVWWTVSIYAFLAFWPVALSELWTCGSLSYLYGADCTLDVYYRTELDPVVIRFALHISSSIFILILPISRIWGMQMPLSKKLSVAAVFALVIFDIAIGVLRNTSTLTLDTIGPTSETAYAINIVCNYLECAIAVVVCSLPPYRALVFKLRAKGRNGFELPDSPASLKRRWHKPREVFASLSAHLRPYFQISILDERALQTTNSQSAHALTRNRKYKSIHLSSIESETPASAEIDTSRLAM